MHPEQNDRPTEDLRTENKPQRLESFIYEGIEQKVSFIEITHVIDGVDCEVYTFLDDETKDLGIIKIGPGKRTPLQKVLKGEKTVEGYVSGKGKLTITKTDGKQEVYTADGSTDQPIVVSVNVGEDMQWEADAESNLTAFEVCIPPYEYGRFENIE